MNIQAIVQGCLLMAVAFVGGQLWALNNELRDMKGDVKYMLGQTPRLDRLADGLNELRQADAVRDSQIKELIKRADIHREVLLKLQKQVDG
jgi:hypothetical protein